MVQKSVVCRGTPFDGEQIVSIIWSLLPELGLVAGWRFPQCRQSLDQLMCGATQLYGLVTRTLIYVRNIRKPITKNFRQSSWHYWISRHDISCVCYLTDGLVSCQVDIICSSTNNWIMRRDLGRPRDCYMSANPWFRFWTDICFQQFVECMQIETWQFRHPRWFWAATGSSP